MEHLINQLVEDAASYGKGAGEKKLAIDRLKELLSEALKTMGFKQYLVFLRSETVRCLFPDQKYMIKKAQDALVFMESAVVAAGYEVKVQFIDGTFFWENEGEDSEDFSSREDAVVGAYNHLTAAQAAKPPKGHVAPAA